MSHAADEGDNYWPGYVDALTSMVQVLAFVMMMLAMAVFVLSQSITKKAVEAIAKAANIEVSSTGNVKQLTGDIVEKLQKLTNPDPASRPTSQADATSQSEVTKPAEPEKMVATANPSIEAAPRPITSSRAKQEQAEIKRPPDSPYIVLEFNPKSFKLDAQRSAELDAFAAGNVVKDGAGMLVVQAFAWSGEGALTEARRLAYYRAMMVRKQLVERKLNPEKIRINVHDTLDQQQGSKVEAFVMVDKTP